MNSPRLKSIVDHDLASFAQGGSGRESVIVEAARPAAGAPPAKAVRRTVTAPADVLPKARPAVQQQPGRSGGTPRMPSMAQLKRTLEALGLGERARANHLSGAYTLEVTPSELRSLATQDSVQAIRKNRRRRLIGV